MGTTRKQLIQKTKTYAFFVGKLNDTQNATHLNMEQMRLARLRKSLYFFNQGTFNAKTEAGGKMYADNIRSKGRYQPAFFTLTYDIKKHPAYTQYEYWKQQCADLGIEKPKALSRHSIWKPYHITQFVQGMRNTWLRKWKLPRKDFRYAWVAELQEDGVIHYHGVVWHPRGKGSYANDLWKWGSRNVFEGVRKGVAGYLMKYLSKGSVKKDAQAGTPARYFPKGARIFGYGGLSSAERATMRYAKLPRYVQDIFDKDDGKVERCPGGWKQGKVELMSPWTYHNDDSISVSGHTDLFKGVNPDNMQTDITGKTANDFTFGLLEYNQVVWLLKDADKYRKQYQDEKREQQRIYDKAYRDATSIPCSWADLSPLIKRFLPLTEEEYNLKRLEQIVQVMNHTSTIKVNLNVY